MVYSHCNACLRLSQFSQLFMKFSGSISPFLPSTGSERRHLSVRERTERGPPSSGSIKMRGCLTADTYSCCSPSNTPIMHYHRAYLLFHPIIIKLTITLLFFGKRNNHSVTLLSLPPLINHCHFSLPPSIVSFILKLGLTTFQQKMLIHAACKKSVVKQSFVHFETVGKCKQPGQDQL